MRATPSLPKAFGTIGACVFVLAAATVGWIQYERSVAQMRKAAEEHSAALATALANALEKELSDALESGRALPPSRLGSLSEKILETIRGTRIVKVKIYNRDGLTIFSTDASQIGEDKSANPGFLAARSGNVASSLTYRDRFDSFDGIISERDLLFSYVPVRHGQEIRGVFEIYADVTHFKQEIRQTLVTEILILGIAFGIVFLLLFITVIRGSRLIERQYRKNLQLAAEVARVEALSHAKSEFLMHMSHELRTPLNAVIGFSEIIKDEHFGPIQPASYAGYIGGIHSSALRLLGMIDDLLELARVQVGRTRPSREPVSVAELIDDIIAQLRPAAESGGLVLHVQARRDLPPLATDRRRIRQVFFNILENAVKSTPPGGVVTVKAGLSGDIMEIVVTDTGIGMQAVEVSRTMVPFGGRDASLARTSDGNGLGLPLSRALVEMLGGTLAIESSPRRGTTVRIGFPTDHAGSTALAA